MEPRHTVEVERRKNREVVGSARAEEGEEGEEEGEGEEDQAREKGRVVWREREV